MKTLTLMLAGAALTFVSSQPAHADASTVAEVGSWQTYSDKTGQPNGVVRIYLHEGKLAGMVEKLRPDVSPDAKCTKCSGTQKDKPILGLVIMWGLKKDGDSWTGGTILDPESGDTYHCKVHLAAPDQLELRGYVGIPLLGRTQMWKRL